MTTMWYEFILNTFSLREMAPILNMEYVMNLVMMTLQLKLNENSKNNSLDPSSIMIRELNRQHWMFTNIYIIILTMKGAD